MTDAVINNGAGLYSRTIDFVQRVGFPAAVAGFLLYEGHIFLRTLITQMAIILANEAQILTNQEQILGLLRGLARQ